MLITLVALIIVITTFYAIYGVLKSYFKFRRLSKYGMKTKGVIKEFDIVKGGGDDDKDLYFPIVQFRTYLGFEIRGKPIKGYKEKEYQGLPNEVEVIYLDSDPEEFIIDGQKIKNTRLLIVPIFILVSYEAFKFMSDENPDLINEVMQFFKSL